MWRRQEKEETHVAIVALTRNAFIDPKNWVSNDRCGG